MSETGGTATGTARRADLGAAERDEEAARLVGILSRTRDATHVGAATTPKDITRTSVSSR